MGSGFLRRVSGAWRKNWRNEEFHCGAAGIPLTTTSEILQQTYTPDFICYEEIILELKAVKDIAPEHKAQILNYLKASNLKLGLLINFGSHPKAQVERFVL